MYTLVYDSARTFFCKSVGFVYSSVVAEQKPIPVRLSEDIISRLDEAAGKIGSNRAALIRLCTQTFLDHLDQAGFGAMPMDWQNIIEESDGRRIAHLNETKTSDSPPIPPLVKVKYRAKMGGRKTTKRSTKKPPKTKPY